MPNDPQLTQAQRLARLDPLPAGKKVDLVMDTDTYNEIDDQFAVVWAMLSLERFNVQSIHAAPFHNERSTGPEDGMVKSHAEILRLLDRLNHPAKDFVFEGSRRWLGDDKQPVDSPAARDLIRRAMARGDEPLYVVAIGAITNIASALLLEPRIADKIVLLWLGGHPTTWHTTNEFNLKQDVPAAQVVFDSGVPLVLLPCVNVAEHLRTTLAEVERYVKGRGTIGDYLTQTFAECHRDHFAYSRVIWDLAPLAWLINADWVKSTLIPSPRPTPSFTWERKPHRHLIREAITIHRDAVFADLFRKLQARADCA